MFNVFKNRFNLFAAVTASNVPVQSDLSSDAKPFSPKQDPEYLEEKAVRRLWQA